MDILADLAAFKASQMKTALAQNPGEPSKRKRRPLTQLNMPLDSIIGVHRIASYLGTTWIAVRYLIDSGTLPARKIDNSNVWCASRSALNQLITDGHLARSSQRPDVNKITPDQQNLAIRIAKLEAQVNTLLGHRENYSEDPSPRSVKHLVAHHYGFHPNDLSSKAKTPPKLVRARQVAMYLASKFGTVTAVGRLFNNRDHTTVIYSSKKIEALRITDKALDIELAHLEETIRNPITEHKSAEKQDADNSAGSHQTE